MANQYTSQLDETIKDAIFGNVGTIFSFTLGYDDASVMTSQFKEIVSVNDMISLPKFTAYTRLMVEGVSSDPFSMKTLPPFQTDGDPDFIEKVRKQSRQRYAMERGKLEKLMNAWNKKSFSAKERIAEKARLEWLGLTPKQVQDLNDLTVEQNIGLMSEVFIDEQPADAMIVDVEQGNHKLVRYEKPKAIEYVAKLQVPKGRIVKLNPNTQLEFFVDIWQHMTEIGSNKKPLTIWVGSAEEVEKQIKELYLKAGLDPETTDFMKIIPNIELLEEKNTKSEPDSPNSPSTPQEIKKAPKTWSRRTFDLSQLKIGEEYEGYVKLIYNYGIFVTVKGVEWLLHKKLIQAPDGIDWKKYYNIGDKILVKLQEIKEVNGEQRVVRSQK